MELEELEALGVAPETIPEIEEVEEIKEKDEIVELEEETLELTAKEQIAYDQGWRPEDNFTGKDGNWKTAGEYIMYGEHQEQLREIKADQRKQASDFDNRISSLNKLHVAQTEAKIKNLKQAQREAVEDNDLEAFDKLETEIKDQTDQQAKAVKPAATDSRPQEVVDWESKNPWISDANSKKANDAQFYYKQAWDNPELNGNYKAIFDYVDKQMAESHPSETPTNPRRSMPTNTEQSTRTTPRGGKSRALTMNDLTQDERSAWNQFSDAGLFSSEKEYLQAVTDTRKSK